MAEAATCTHYASPNGGGNGLSQSSPFQIANFWSVAGPGKTLCLLDGVYSDSNSMIDPPDNLAGTSGNPIKIKALNDGGVRIDGQAVRQPISLNVGNSWFVIEGMNAHNAVGSVVTTSNGSNNNIIRRVVAWDGGDINAGVIQAYQSSNNLFEDVAAFGVNRNTMAATQNANSTIFRRAWSMYGTNVAGAYGPHAAFETFYNSSDFLGENLIGTWDSTTSVTGYAGDDAIYEIANGGNGKLLGSIFYVMSWAAFTAHKTVYSDSTSPLELRDIVSFLDSNWSGKYPFVLYNRPGCSGNSNCKLTNTTEIGGQSSIIESDWIQSNRVDVGSAAQAPSIWNGSGTQGARVCKQYVNGTLTSNPLWPWPMDARIRAALIQSGRNPDSVFGGSGNSVTQLMEQKFGAIPAECRAGISSSLLLGDINNDKIVNSLDWSLMSAKWLTSDTSADLNKDGAVNSLDWSIMSSNWLKTI